MPDYREVFTQKGKGEHYHTMYRDSPGIRYLWKREQRVLRSILRRYFEDKQIEHLDFACGTGRVLSFLSKHTAASTGVDISEDMLGLCRQEAPNAEIIQADITRDDVLDGRLFDLVTAFRFFPNAQPSLRRDAMKALVRHLAPGGVLVLNNHENYAGSIYRVARLIRKKELPTMHSRELKELISGADLEIATVFPLGLLPFSARRLVVPGFVHTAFDAVANTLGLGAVLAQDIIYVCRRKH